MEYRGLDRCTCPEILNFYLNHKEIKKWITQDNAPYYVDSTELLSKEDTYFFLFEGGGLLFFRDDDRVFEGDVFFLPRKRGKNSRKAAIEAINFMLTVTDKIKAQVPLFNKQAQHFVIGLGFKRTHIERESRLLNDVNHDVIYYMLER